MYGFPNENNFPGALPEYRTFSIAVEEILDVADMTGSIQSALVLMSLWKGQSCAGTQFETSNIVRMDGKYWQKIELDELAECVHLLPGQVRRAIVELKYTRLIQEIAIKDNESLLWIDYAIYQKISTEAKP